MTIYNPDSWVPVVIESAEYGKVYKILASWYGGFAGANSWKLSSGIEDIVLLEDGRLEMPQSSGSTYVVTNQTHVSSIMGGVYQRFKNELANTGDSTIEMLSVQELLDAFGKPSNFLAQKT